MPTNQPSNAPDPLPGDAADQNTAAAVLHDEDEDDTPGGGGLLGRSGAAPDPTVAAGHDAPEPHPSSQ